MYNLAFSNQTNWAYDRFAKRSSTLRTQAAPMISFIEMILNILQNFLAHFARHKVTIITFHKIQLVFVYNLTFSN